MLFEIVHKKVCIVMRVNVFKAFLLEADTIPLIKSIYPNTKILLVIIFLILGKIDKEIHRRRFTQTSEQFGEGCRK